MSIAEERDKAFIKAVVDDDWKAVLKYSKKYCVPVPKEEKIMKAGIYKAVQYCTNIPDDVKLLAIEKCLKLGFSPLITPIEEEREELIDDSVCD